MDGKEIEFLKKALDGVDPTINPVRVVQAGHTGMLIKMFPDDKAARLWCEGVVWPDGPVCPRCNSCKHIYTQIHAA